MKYAFVSAGIIAFGLIGLTLLFLFGALTVNNEQDYYNLKEVTEAAMVESIDIAYYRDTGELKMSQEKFVENFNRRLAESTAAGVSNYDVIFEDIVERPPKVSVVIVTSTGEYTVYGDTTSFDIANKIDAILAYSPTEDSNSLGTDDPDAKEWVPKEMKVKFYSIPYASATRHQFRGPVVDKIKKFIPDSLNECLRSDIRNVEFERVENVKTMTTQAEVDHYNLVKRDTYDYDWENSASYQKKDALIRYQAESITVGTSNFEYYYNNNDTNIDSNDVYTCNSNVDGSVENVIVWSPSSYDCGDNVLPENIAVNGATIRNTCLVGITYDVVFTYEQYE